METKEPKPNMEMKPNGNEIQVDSQCGELEP